MYRYLSKTYYLNFFIEIDNFLHWPESGPVKNIILWMLLIYRVLIYGVLNSTYKWWLLVENFKFYYGVPKSINIDVFSSFIPRFILFQRMCRCILSCLDSCQESSICITYLPFLVPTVHSSKAVRAWCDINSKSFQCNIRF